VQSEVGVNPNRNQKISPQRHKGAKIHSHRQERNVTWWIFVSLW
jgi:hypothetical protein